jgi:L-ascorbate metabolism protein UlaG (beta-lactamase superfamily)
MTLFQKKSIYLCIIPVILIIFQSCSSFSVDDYEGKDTDYYYNHKFHNLKGEQMPDFWDFAPWLLTRRFQSWQKVDSLAQGPPPVKYAGDNNLLATWVNHATMLIQADSLNILTDPVWSETMGPFQYPGIERAIPPLIKFDDLPVIHVVLISHNHYDHLDLPTVKRLRDKCNPLFIVPLGNKKFLENNGITNVKEIGWWDSLNIDGIKIFSVPAKHSANRWFFDSNRSLWCGYVISSKKGNSYFAGDTGWGQHFEMIKKRFGSFRLCMLPIGPIKPKALMHLIHLNPEDAVKVHKLLEPDLSIGIHYLTFPQGEDQIYEPVLELFEELKKNNISPQKFILVNTGKSINIK